MFPNLKTKALFLITAILVTTPGAALAMQSRYVIGTPGVAPAELKAFATSKEAIPFSEYQEAARPGVEFESELSAKFARAQRTWLAGQTDSARSEFRSLTELVQKADWRDPQREVLLTSFLRLAQSTLSGTEKTSWLDSAAKYFSDLNPQPKLFPPPLIEEFEAAKVRALESAVSIEPWTVFPEFRFVLIDGRKIEVASRKAILLPSGTHRITALSDTHVGFTEFLTANQLRLFRTKPIAMAEGSCSNARITQRSSFATDPILFVGSDCAGGPQQLELKPQLLNAHLMSELGSKPQTASSKKTWLWIVGGAVIAGAGYALARELNRDKAPDQIHRSGF